MKKLGAGVITFLLMLGLVILMALPTMWSWDAIMPKYFGLKEITFWDAVMLNVLASCLFKSSSNSKT